MYPYYRFKGSAPQFVPLVEGKITKDALVKRINRKLRKRNGALKKSRSSSARAELGEYYVVIDNIIYTGGMHVDIEVLGAELGVLRENETLVD